MKFPSKMVYNTSWVSTTSYLGPSKDQPLFSVQTPSRLINCLGLGKIILRNGTDKHAPQLASVGAEKGSFLRRSLISVALNPHAPKQGSLDITMSGDWSRTHEFSMPLKGGITERFEWRHSRGDEVHELSGGYNYGWKLIRLDGTRSYGHGYTSDGMEVVAVGAHPRIFHKSPAFAFLGSADRGELGESFEIVAIMGFLRLYELSVQQQSVNSSAAAGAASVGVTT